jgi:hypothetical protein
MPHDFIERTTFNSMWNWDKYRKISTIIFQGEFIPVIGNNNNNWKNTIFISKGSSIFPVLLTNLQNPDILSLKNFADNDTATKKDITLANPDNRYVNTPDRDVILLPLGWYYDAFIQTRKYYPYILLTQSEYIGYSI